MLPTRECDARFLERIADHGAVPRVSLVEVSQLPINNEGRHAAHRRRDVAPQALLLLGAEQAEQGARLSWPAVMKS